MQQKIWEVAFPNDLKTEFAEIQSEQNNKIGVVVRCISPAEARFIIRGDLTSKNDLLNCLSLAEQLAAKFSCKTLVTQEKISTTWYDSATTFMTAGYELTDESWVFSGPFSPFAERVINIETLLHRKNAIPANSKITNLVDCHERVRDLLNDKKMMDDFEFDHCLKSSSSQTISKEFSQIAWCEDEIVGVILVSSSEELGVYYIPIRYVTPEFRQTWVNALLIAECVKHGPAAGANIVRFEANLKTHKETMLLAEKTGCERIGIFNRYQKYL